MPNEIPVKNFLGLEKSSEKGCKENQNIKLIGYIHFSENHNICE
jgi:hypothetical protein